MRTNGQGRNGRTSQRISIRPGADHLSDADRPPSACTVDHGNSLGEILAGRFGDGVSPRIIQNAAGPPGQQAGAQARDGLIERRNFPAQPHRHTIGRRASGRAS